MKARNSLNSIKAGLRATVNMAVLGVLAGAACFSTGAHADYVAGETPSWQGAPLTSFVQGSPSSSLNQSIVVRGGSLIVNQFSLPSSGTLTIRLSDIKWPDALSSLSFLVTDLDNMWQKLDGAGNLLVNVSGPTQLFAAVYAQSANGDAYGLYNLRADFSPVPLPAAVWLLLSGLGGLGLMRRKPAP